MKLKKVFFVILMAIILFGIILRIGSLNKDFTAEETDFIKPAIALFQTGHTIFYHSEQQPHELGLWHPPMYIYSLATSFMLFGINEISARSINVLFSILTALLIFLFSLKAFENKGILIGLMASAFFLINYYVLSSSIMIDIDLLSTFFIFAFVFSVFMSYKENKIIYHALAVLSFIFALANRYPIAALVFISLLAYFLINKDYRNYAKKFLFIGFIASLVALLIWIGYSTVIEPGTFWSFVLHNTKLGSEQFSNFMVYLFSFILNVSQFIRLVTFPAVILIAVAIFYFIKRKDTSIRLLLIYSSIILIFFFIVPRPAFGYPRYFVSAFPGLAILIAVLIYETIKRIKLTINNIILIVLTFIGTLILLIFISPAATLYESNGLVMATNLPDFLFNLVCIAPVLLIFLAEKEKRSKLIILLLLSSSFAYCSYFDSSLVLHEAHIKETGEYVLEHSAPNDLIVVPKAIGYYAERKFYVNDNNKPEINNLTLAYFKEYITKSFENRNMNDEFFWSKGYFSSIYEPRPTKEVLDKVTYLVLYHPIGDSLPEIKIGNFYVYRLKNSYLNTNL